MLRCIWNEYTTKDGHKYWYNTNTKKSVWEMPEEYKEYLMKKERIERANSISISSHSLPTSSSSSLEPLSSSHRKSYSPLPSNYISSSSILPPPSLSSSSSISPIINSSSQLRPGLSKAEAAMEFYTLLDEYRIPSGMPWPDVIATVQNDPRWNIISNISDKKEAFDDYCKLAIGRERERDKQQIEEARKKYRKLLESTPEIKPHMKFVEVEQLLGNKKEYFILLYIVYLLK